MQTEEAVGKEQAEQYTEQNSITFISITYKKKKKKKGKVKEEEEKIWLWDFAKRQPLVIKAIPAEHRNESQLEKIH